MRTRNMTSAFMLFLATFFLVSQLLLSEVIRPLLPDTLARSPWILIVSHLVSLLLPLVIWLALTKDKFSRHMPRQPLGARNMVFTLLLSFLLLPTMWLISGISSLFVENRVPQLLGSFDAPPLWLMLLAIAVTPGIVEEVVFRGYVQSTQHGQGVKKLVLMNGLFFAIIHFDVHQFFYTFALGAVFAYMVYYTKNIWAGIIPHFIVNGVNVLISHITSRVVSGYVAENVASQTFAESVYEAVREIDPELAGRMYDMLQDVSIEAVAIALVVILTAITLPFAIWILFALRSYNNNRNAVLAEAAEEAPPTHEDGEVEPTFTPPDRPQFTVDWYLVGLIAFYIFVVFIMFE